MEKVKIGLIGLGQRGTGWLEYLAKDWGKDIDIVAVCDVFQDRVDKALKIIEEHRKIKVNGYTNYIELLKDINVEAVIIGAAWEAHVPIAVASMKAKKITALEVGGAYSVDDCWELVKTYEETNTPFFFMENCCYGERELLATGLVRKGALGEVVYCHGSYCHDLREEISYGLKNRHYRLRNYIGRNCDNYPTHELGPIAKLLKINRGNRMVSLVSMASKARGLETYVKTQEELKSLVGTHFKQGDVVETLISCADGTMISLKLDTTLPHAYSREFTVNGTKGMCSEQGNIVLLDGKFDHDCGMDDYRDTANEYKKTYMPKIWRDMTQEQIDAGHGGMDALLMRAFVDAVQNGKEMPIDVYDAASWMVISVLSEQSIARGGCSVEVPDFTRGKWLMRENKDVVDFDL